jgi:hypothetical protein
MLQVNDVLRTTICLRYKPAHIAACALFVAAAHTNIEKVTLRRLGLTLADAKPLCEEIYELYQPQPGEVSVERSLLFELPIH